MHENQEDYKMLNSFQKIVIIGNRKIPKKFRHFIMQQKMDMLKFEFICEEKLNKNIIKELLIQEEDLIECQCFLMHVHIIIIKQYKH